MFIEVSTRMSSFEEKSKQKEFSFSQIKRAGACPRKTTNVNRQFGEKS
jgi:hypothetical protein